MKEKIELVYDALQRLEMKPTPVNTSVMNGVYSILREIYKELGENEVAKSEKGTTADLQRRDND